MIKKNTKIIFKDESGKKINELAGGIPLTEGEIIKIYGQDSKEGDDYIVANKKIEFYINEDEQTANITYTLKKNIK